jgi:hypothetical protein
MVIRGRAQLVDRAIKEVPALPEADRVRILRSLAAIDEAVVSIVEMIDEKSPTPLIGLNGRDRAPRGPHAS